MTRSRGHLDFSHAGRYTQNFWVRHAARDGRWTLPASWLKSDDLGGPEAGEPVMDPTNLPVLAALAALKLPSVEELEAVGVGR